ncbi:hypothetical protein A9Q84_14775 [Halobacteriovorax marinus]|uniref:TfoX N-terminal domain-containing protein n=1 Tax=Halobacteriovorax marinus TaxID=97084 RepID=A0A1Y5FAI3_9BACT|nr:hypothetical protein A9Q84_14775 [Halobacteriovorax marinus]
MKPNLKNKYLEKIQGIVFDARPRLSSSSHQLEFKNCFGAVAGYLDNQIFITCGKFGLALRLPPKSLDKLFEQRGVKTLKYFKNGHIKKEYAVIPKYLLEDKIGFKKLIDKSILFAKK